MLFYLDENVPAQVEAVIVSKGHEVRWKRDIIPEGSPDQMVAAVSEDAGAILVSHDKDFKRIAPRIPDGQRTRFRKLSMLRLECKKPKSAHNVGNLFDFIELEARLRGEGENSRLMISIRDSSITIFR